MNVDNTKSLFLQYAGTIAMVVALLVLGMFIYSSYKKYARNKRNKLARNRARLQYDEIVGMARELNGKLGKVSEGRSDPVDQIVQFFSLTSPIQDTLQGITLQEDYLTHSEFQHVNAIRRVVGAMGRCETGWNRTKTGQAVTEDNVFLGNVYGIWTRTVRFFQDELRLGRFPDTQYALIQEQARSFMSSCITHLTTVLEAKE